MEHNRHIAFVVGYLRPGGAERVLSQLANFFVAENNRVSLINMDHREDFYSLDSRVERYFLPTIPGARNPLDGLYKTYKRVRFLRDQLLKIQPDVVISFITDVNVLTTLATRKTGIPVVISERSNPYYAKIPRHWKIAARLFYRFADIMVLQTGRAGSFYRYLDQHKKVVIPNPVIPVHDKEKRRKLVILAVGRLESMKGYDLLLQAFAQTKAQKNWKLVILGEGAERGKLERLRKELNLTKQVEMPGVKKNTEDFYRTASVFVLSSRYEGYPNALAEAMSHGIACISFNCDYGPAEMIASTENGLLVENGNVNELAKAIDRVTEDKILRDQIGANARISMQKNDIQTIGSQWIRMIDQLIRNAGSSNG